MRLRYAYHLLASLLSRKRPENLVLAVVLAAQVATIIVHFFVPGETPLVAFLDVLTALLLIIPIASAHVVSLSVYSMILAVLATAFIDDMSARFPGYYYALLVPASYATLKLEPVLVASPLARQILILVEANIKKIKPPRTRLEILTIALGSAANIVGIFVSGFLYLVYGYLPALVALIYNVSAATFFWLGIYTNPITYKPTKYGIPLLFVMRYPFAATLANRMADKIKIPMKRAGLIEYAVGYVAKYVMAAIIIWLLAPTIGLILYPFGKLLALVGTIITVAVGILAYYMPKIIIGSMIKARKSGVEREYPLFMAYLTAMVSSGKSMYRSMKDLIESKGAELFEAFRKEAQLLVTMVDVMNKPEPEAIYEIASYHPSETYRNFLFGYVNQLRLSGRLVEYMDEKLREALEIYKRRLESFKELMMVMISIVIITIVFPSIVIIMSAFLNPAGSQPILYAMIFGVIPLLILMFNSVVTALGEKTRDVIRMTYVPGVVGGTLGAVLGFMLFRSNIVLSLATIVAGISLGVYLEFERFRREYSKIEKALPDIWRDLASLRQTMPISEAVQRLAANPYPKEVRRILRKVAALRQQGELLSEQPWASGSWFWRFTQFLIGEIERAGGGTASLFNKIMMFFSDYNLIKMSFASEMKMYEGMLYMTPIIFVIIPVIIKYMAASVSGLAPSLSSITSAGAEISLPASVSALLSGFPSSLIMLADLMSLEITIGLGIVANKSVGGSVKYARPLLVMVLIFILSYIFAPLLFRIG